MQRKEIATPFGTIVECALASILSDHATEFMLKHLEITAGSAVAEVGCGSGVICIFASKAGAARVYGTDIDAAAISIALDNAAKNRAENVSFLYGSLLEPVPRGLDTIIALLPHKPAPRPFNPRYYGGQDGTDLLLPCIEQSAEKLVQGGSLYLYLNSIANPRRTLSAFRENFDVQLLADKKRYFSKDEFDSLTEGMFAHLLRMKSEGKAEFYEDERGFLFTAGIYLGTKR
jgi:16S rRNA G1207 methylase RsmC